MRTEEELKEMIKKLKEMKDFDKTLGDTTRLSIRCRYWIKALNWVLKQEDVSEEAKKILKYVRKDKKLGE